MAKQSTRVASLHRPCVGGGAIDGYAARTGLKAWLENRDPTDAGSVEVAIELNTESVGAPSCSRFFSIAFQSCLHRRRVGGGPTALLS
jgi:hypothetical protein